MSLKCTRERSNSLNYFMFGRFFDKSVACIYHLATMRSLRQLCFNGEKRDSRIVLSAEYHKGY